MDHWFADPTSGSSAHYGIGLGGRIHQYVELEDRAWTNGYTEPGHLWPGPPEINPNDLTVTVEMEDWGGVLLVPDGQYQSAVAVGRLTLSRYPKIRYLITHRAIAPETRANDPGPRWVASGRFAALARDLGLIPIP
jgi:N-acetyl-anhydromuramyl-L-alanine amidase AmpD